MKANASTRILSDKLTSALPAVQQDVEAFLLRNAEKIDFEYHDGEFFGLAMKNSSALLKLLVDTYVATKLQGNPHSTEYLAAKVKLKSMLEEQVDSSPYELDELDEAIQAILRPWMTENVDSDVDEQDLDILGDVFVEDDNAHADASAAHEQQVPDFCGWPEALSHQRHLSGENGNGFSPEVF